VRNDNIFSAYTFAKPPFYVVLGIGLREPDFSFPSPNSSFPLLVLVVKAYGKTSFATLDALSVSPTHERIPSKRLTIDGLCSPSSMQPSLPLQPSTR
jgi:hypothetical protein